MFWLICFVSVVVLHVEDVFNLADIDYPQVRGSILY